MTVPTSLIVVLLVAAWLAVLVPMVARRREKVPEIEEHGARFRVLRRASETIRRNRPHLRRPVQDLEEVEDSVDVDGEQPGELEEELLDSEFDDDLEDDLDDSDLEDEYEDDEEAVAPAASLRKPVTFGGWRKAEKAAVTADPMGEESGSPARDSDWGSVATLSVEDSAVDDFAADDSVDERLDDEHLDDERYRPVPLRRGRGGYDPEAAEATRAYKYQRRRRVTTVLLLATVAFSLAAYLLVSALWAVAVVAGLLLVSYLAYLRRQVRIEENIRQRRLAKLRRARQIRPEYHPAAYEDAAPAPIAGQSLPPVAARASAPPLAYQRGRRVVDLEDDDPGFDELDHYQEPIEYRRASGQ